jgi:HD superfamily phosphohydrolase
MFDNVYWHHANRACMAMLLRAVQDAVSAGLPANELTAHDDASLLARLAAEDMPVSTRRLVAGLRERRLHKRAIEIGARAGDLYAYLGQLFYDPAARRALERQMAATLAEETGLAVEDGDILLDIPKPERWRTDVWVTFENPPVGFTKLMPWQDVAGITDDDLKRYEEHRRLLRIVAVAPLRDAVRARWERLLLPLSARG